MRSSGSAVRVDAWCSVFASGLRGYALPGISGEYRFDTWIAHFDAAGNELWRKSYAALAIRVAATVPTGVIVVGVGNGSDPFGRGTIAKETTFVAKLDQLVATVCVRTFASTGST